MYFVCLLSICSNYNSIFCNEFLAEVSKFPMFWRDANGRDFKQVPIYEMRCAFAAVFGAMTAGLWKIKFAHDLTRMS
jgi:hypothetical protein